VFSVEERARVRDLLLARAEADDAVGGAAFTGSVGAGEGDRWSDTDLVLAVRGDLGVVADRWTRWLYDDLGARHHWDLPAEARIIRVFLLPDWMEIDLNFVPEAGFGPRGPQWRTVFGQAQPLEPFPGPDRRYLTGLMWNSVLHARVSLERERWWQAEYWLSSARDQVIALACLRLDYPAVHAKGAHLLPDDLMARLPPTLVRSLDEPELRRALNAVTSVAVYELQQSDPGLARVLSPMLADLAGQ
jgi:hypothetical protein